MSSPQESQEHAAVTKVKRMFPKEEALLEMSNPKDVAFWVRNVGFSRIARLYRTSRKSFDKKNDLLMALAKELSAINA